MSESDEQQIARWDSTEGPHVFSCWFEIEQGKNLGNKMQLRNWEESMKRTRELGFGMGNGCKLNKLSGGGGH